MMRSVLGIITSKRKRKRKNGNPFVFIMVCLVLLLLKSNTLLSECQLIRMDGQQINTDYILYVLKGLYAYGEHDEPFVFVGKKKDLSLNVSHITFENVGVSTADNRNTKYFSFQEVEKTVEQENRTKKDKEKDKEKEGNEAGNGNNEGEKEKEKEKEREKEEEINGDNNTSKDTGHDVTDSTQHSSGDSNSSSSVSGSGSDSDSDIRKTSAQVGEGRGIELMEEESQNSSENSEQKNGEENKKKKNFSLNVYKNNPYMRRKEETEYMDTEENGELPYLFLELIIMKEKDFNENYLPQNNKVCCEKEELNGRDDNSNLEYTCPGRGYIKKYKHISNFHSVKLPVYFINERAQYDDEPYEYEVTKEDFEKKIKASITYKITETSIYALFLSNCVESKTYELNLHGNIHILNNYGYLPGDKIAKLNLYFFCMVVFFLYFVVWLFLLIKNRKFVIKIQMWILVCLLFYEMEHFFLFLYFLEYNLSAKVNNKLLTISVCSSILKNVCSYLLILLGSLGWGIVVPTLDRQTSLKIKILFFFFILFDFVKQFLDLYLHDSIINSIFVFIYICPITFIYAIIYLWIFSSSSKIMMQLNEDKQYEKLNMFKNFFNVLVFTLMFALISFLINIFVILDVGSINWSLKCYLSEGVSSFLFILILTAMMFLFKPSERLRRISHFTEIGDMDEMEDFSNFKTAGEDVP